MRWLLAAALFATACHHGSVRQTNDAVEYTNGHWFDGTKFVDKTMCVAGDRFAADCDARRIVDLHGGFVVPPYGDAHNHWLEANLVDAYIATNLRDGIFYLRDQSTPIHDLIRPKVNIPKSLDYIAAHQGFTGPGGHPIELVDLLVQFHVLPDAWATTHGEGDALFVVTTEADIDRDWPKLMATKPDFVKLFLVHSDEYAKRRDDASLTPKQRGMDPALVPAIVKRAHAAHLSVSAHIENAADFHVAIAAGVDEIAHMPFVENDGAETYRLAEEDVVNAGARHVPIATTMDFIEDNKPGSPVVEVTRDNIKRLREAGVVITIGTDLFRQTAAFEVDRIARLGLMSNLELLHAWSIDTPRAIIATNDLPRSLEIARLEPGFDASFLVLSADPLADPANLHKITLRMKQGVFVMPGPETLPPFAP